MHTSLRISLAAAALAVAAPALATNGMRMIGFGPVQTSMGGVSAAAPLDAAVLVTNPAGITALSTRVDLSGTAFAPSVKFDATWTPDGANMFTASQSSDRPTDFIPTLAAVYRVADRMTLGFAALGTAGMGVDYKTDLYQSKTYTSYVNMRFAPGAAYKVTDQLSVGLTANVSYAMMKYEAGGMPLHDTTGSFGIGATVGASYAITPAATVALAYESRSYFQDYEWTVPAHMTQRGPVPGGVDKLAFDQPDVATLGGSYRVVPSLLLAADVGLIRWSTTNGKDQPEFVDTNLAATGSMPWNLNWSDQVVVKVGAELAATKELKIRAGYNYGKSPLDENRAFENIAFPAIAQNHVTAGVGYDVGKLTVNVSALYSPESKLSGSNAMQQGIIAYETKMSQLSFDLGLAYRF